MKINMTNEELVFKIQSGEDVKANMDKLYNQNIKFIKMLLKPYRSLYGTSMSDYKGSTTVIEIEDLEQEAFFGFRKAVFSYKSDHDAKFLTYCDVVINRHLHRFCYKNKFVKRIPEHMNNKIYKYNTFINSYKIENNKMPSEQEILYNLNISKIQLDSINKCLYESFTCSIDEKIPGVEDMVVVDSLTSSVDIEGDVIEKVFNEECAKNIWEIVNTLNDIYKIVIVEKYKNNKTQASIANQLHISNNAISLREKQALKILRNNKDIKKIAEYYGVGNKYHNVYDSSQLYKSGYSNFKNNKMSSVEQAIIVMIETEKKLNQILQKVNANY